MKNTLLTVLAILIVLFSNAGANVDENPEGIMKDAFANYNSVSSEIEYAKVTTTNWGKEPRYSVSWVKRKDTSNELMFVLNWTPTLKKNPDGVLIKSENGNFDLPILFQKRRKIKKKNSGFADKSNGTELGYVDLMRMVGESTDNLNLSFYSNQPDKRIKSNIIWSIKAIPKDPISGDYAFRIFHIGIVEEVKVILAIECFDESNRVKLQCNLGFKELKNGNTTVIREKIRHFITDEGKTVIKVSKRKLGANFGKLDEEALKKGQP